MLYNKKVVFEKLKDMILNEKQYKITKTQIKKFEQSVQDLEEKEHTVFADNVLRFQAHLDSLTSQLEELKEDVQKYESLKNGSFQEIEANLEDLPILLIKARIAKGLTQEEFANLLGVKMQQVQRDESERYQGASMAKIVKIIKALDLQFGVKLLHEGKKRLIQ